MQRNSLHALTLALMLAALPALAGCIGTAAASAMEEQDAAEDLAMDWDPNAQLVQVIGVEGQGWGAMFSSMAGAWSGDASSPPKGDHWARAADDEEPGDGRCEVWAYRFTSPNKPGKAYVVVLDRDGEVLREAVEEAEDDDVPIGAWEVDSDEAAEIARDHNQGLAQGTGSEHYGIVLALGRDDDHGNAVWFVAGGGGDDSGGGGGMVVLDAVTGEVYASQGGFGSSPSRR